MDGFHSVLCVDGPNISTISDTVIFPPKRKTTMQSSSLLIIFLHSVS
jgi:hypothetical protein